MLNQQAPRLGGATPDSDHPRGWLLLHQVFLRPEACCLEPS
jgi:hypothetical protein